MFLATTALSKFWNKEEPLLFLGSWCLPYDRRKEWEGLDYSVLPDLWDDLSQSHTAINYLEQRYEGLINDLTKYLNSVHDVSHKSRYWRIILGPWLRRYLHTVYDRYCHLKEALRQQPDLDTYVLDPEDFQTYEDTVSFSAAIRLDEYNLMIFSQILLQMGYEYPTRRLESGWPQPQVLARVRHNSLPRVILRIGKKVLDSIERRIAAVVGRSRPIALCGMYLGSAEVWSLALRTRLKAAPLEIKSRWSSPVPAQSKNEARMGLSSLPASDEFSRIFAEMLPANFPALYMEGYKTAQTDTLRRHPKFPKVLASLIGWSFNEPFKFLAAEASKSGTRLVTSQHGGLYGISRFIPEESHESNISDSYLVWGWAHDETTAYRNLPSPKLSTEIGINRKQDKLSKERTVLFLGVTGPQYILRFISAPLGSQWGNYHEWELRFLDASSERMRGNIIFRPLHVEYGWRVKERISDRFPDIKWDDGQPFRQRLKTSHIMVLDNPITTFLEALVANIPTIVFWDPGRWEFRVEAQPYFDNLREVGILWDNPEDAAAKLESIYGDPWAWWGSDAVQESRRRFVNRYGLANNNWASQWAKALKEEANLYKAVNV